MHVPLFMRHPVRAGSIHDLGNFLIGVYCFLYCCLLLFGKIKMDCMLVVLCGVTKVRG